MTTNKSNNRKNNAVPQKKTASNTPEGIIIVNDPQEKSQVLHHNHISVPYPLLKDLLWHSIKRLQQEYAEGDQVLGSKIDYLKWTALAYKLYKAISPDCGDEFSHSIVELQEFTLLLEVMDNNSDLSGDEVVNLEGEFFCPVDISILMMFAATQLKYESLHNQRGALHSYMLATEAVKAEFISYVFCGSATLEAIEYVVDTTGFSVDTIVHNVVPLFD